MDENISVLKGIGLTMYEAQAYVTLTSLISSTASEIAEESGIPRSKIYDVLKELAKKNFIEVEDGRPLTYNVKSPVVSASVTFTQDDTNGTYWKLQSGLYTMTAPSETTKDQYVSNNDSPTTYPKYTRNQTKDTAASVSQNTTDNTLYEITGTVDSTTGVLTFTGLGAGDYKLIEVDHPAGYNTAPDVEFTIGNNPVPDATSAHWTNSNTNFSTEDNMYTITIENSKGTTLPSTGGIGTTIFYVVGGTLVAGAVVLLITKKRMSINDQK